jgi:homoserine dehydrogenase
VKLLMEPLNIALIGCGTVGGGVAKLLLKQPERLAARAGRPLVLRRVVVRDLNKQRAIGVPRELLTTDLQQVVRDPDIHVAVELVGGVDWARQAVLELLAAGKDVVTANKALLAQHGTEIFDAARRYGRAVAFEASVAGGVPIIAALAQSLAANQILAIQGILNGTSNFILTSMTEGNQNYADALAEAQRLGYAEADPTLDVNGADAAHKLAILAQIAFGVAVPMSAIECRGIADVDALDIRFAGELGYVIKLLAEAFLSDDQLALHVSPVLLRRATPLAQVRGAYNAISVVGDAVGDTLYYGQGAGQMPTASAVTSAHIPDAASMERQRDGDAAATAGLSAHTVLSTALGGRPAGRTGGGGASACDASNQHRLGDPARNAGRDGGNPGAACHHDAHGGDRGIPVGGGGHGTAGLRGGAGGVLSGGGLSGRVVGPAGLSRAAPHMKYAVPDVCADEP